MASLLSDMYIPMGLGDLITECSTCVYMCQCQLKPKTMMRFQNLNYRIGNLRLGTPITGSTYTPEGVVLTYKGLIKASKPGKTTSSGI